MQVFTISIFAYSVLFWYVIDGNWHETKSIVVNKNRNHLWLGIRKSCCPKFHCTSHEAVHSYDNILFMCNIIYRITPKSSSIKLHHKKCFTSERIWIIWWISLKLLKKKAQLFIITSINKPFNKAGLIKINAACFVANFQNAMHDAWQG